ncbi:TIGR04255 family protein [Stenotrophomonas geniculata]|uniref:TIGR04255 family protein n=1 Tax=Stenotrophomonas geniculata TaxID=86188 RepID=UPI003BF7AF60
MTQQRHLSNPPISEAVIDFVFSLAVTEEQVRGIGKAFRSSKSKDEAVLSEFGHVSTTVNIGSGETHRDDRRFEGVRVSCNDGRLIVQFRADRVTVSHVGHYTDWDDLSGDAIAAASYFQAVAKCLVKKVGTRYINVLSLSRPVGELLVGLPQSVREDWALSDYWDRRVYKDSVGHAISMTFATIAQQPLNQAGPESKVLLFDIDVTKDVEFECGGARMDRTLQELRAVKNAAFFGSLEDTALEQYR